MPDGRKRAHPHPGRAAAGEKAKHHFGPELFVRGFLADRREFGELGSNFGTSGMVGGTNRIKCQRFSFSGHDYVNNNRKPVRGVSINAGAGFSFLKHRR